jgi:hypothetical protein
MSVKHFKRRLPITRAWVLALAIVSMPAIGLRAAEADAEPVAKKAEPPTAITTGSGKQFKTTVERKSEGELSAEDFRQVSLLSSRVVLHLNEAVRSLNDSRSDEVRAQLEKGLALINVVRRLLPSTEVTTIVQDAQGKEVYRYVEHVQDDRVPLHEGLVAVEVVEPISDAKRDAAAVKGVRLADADLLHTSVLVDLDYVERKLKRALEFLKDKPDDALAQLLLAQSAGISFSVNKQDNPLIAAQLALQLAERMVAQNRPEAAKANLEQAKYQLDLYRGLVAEGDQENVRKLAADITKLQGNIEKAGAGGDIREFWHRITQWFSRETGETRSTPKETGKTTDPAAVTK